MDSEDASSQKQLNLAIETLIDQGIDAGDVKQLKDAGIHHLMILTKENLAGIKGLTEAKADKIWEAAMNIKGKHNFQMAMDELKSCLQNFGLGRRVNGAVLCHSLDDATTKVAFAFPSDKLKVKYANILIGDEAFEYEDDDEVEKEVKEVDPAVEKKKLEVDALVLEKLVEAQKGLDGYRFQSVIDFEKKRLKQLTMEEITGDIRQAKSLIHDIMNEIDSRMVQLHEDLNAADLNAGE